MDISTGGDYLYVLDQHLAEHHHGLHHRRRDLLSKPCGSITVFAIDPDTGRLTLVQNQSVKVNGTYLTYTTTGPGAHPHQDDQLRHCRGRRQRRPDGHLPLQVGTSGQLTVNANSTQIIDSPPTVDNITSITTGSSYLYLTDGLNNRILQYTVSSTGVLQPVTGGQVWPTRR